MRKGLGIVILFGLGIVFVAVVLALQVFRPGIQMDQEGITITFPFHKEEVITPREFEVWRKINIGNYNSDSLIHQLKKGGFQTTYSFDILDLPRFSVENRGTHLDLGLISVADLGFTTTATTRKDIYDRAYRIGLELMSLEAVVQLRLQFEPETDKLLMMGMKPIKNKKGDPGLFYIQERNLGFWHGIGPGRLEEATYPPDQLWVFAFPRHK